MKKSLLLVIVFMHSFPLHSQVPQGVSATLGVAGVSLTGIAWAAWKYVSTASQLEKHKSELAELPQPVAEHDAKFAATAVKKRITARKLAAATKSLAINEKILALHRDVPHSQAAQKMHLARLKKYQNKVPTLKEGLAQYDSHTHECEIEQKKDAQKAGSKKQGEICYDVYKAREATKQALNQAIPILQAKLSAETAQVSQLKSLIALNAQYRSAIKPKQEALEKNNKKSRTLEKAGCFFGITFLSALTYYFYSK